MSARRRCIRMNPPSASICFCHSSPAASPAPAAIPAAVLVPAASSSLLDIPIMVVPSPAGARLRHPEFRPVTGRTCDRPWGAGGTGAVTGGSGARAALPDAEDVAGRVAERGDPEAALRVRRLDHLAAVLGDLPQRVVHP